MAQASPQGRPPPRAGASHDDAHGAPPSRPDLLTALRRIAACAARPAERASLFQTIAHQAAALGASDAVVATLDDAALLHVRSGTGVLSWLEGEFMPAQGSFVGQAVQSRSAREAPRLNSDPEAYPLEQELGSGPGLAVPLLVDDQAVGALFLLRPARERPFTQEEIGELCALGDVAGALIAGSAAYDRRRSSRAAAETAAKRAVAPRVAVLPAPASGLTAAELIRALRHEINNPLAVVRAHSQLLERDPLVQEAQPLLDAVQQIADAGRRLGDLTARLAAAEVHPDHAYVTADGGLGVVPEPSSGD
jgi:GAF domain-containing protein